MCSRPFESIYEKAEKELAELVEKRHVKAAQAQIECDQITPVIRTLPTQQKIVLASVLINQINGLKNIQTGEVHHIYKQVCQYSGQPMLSAQGESLDLSLILTC